MGRKPQHRGWTNKAKKDSTMLKELDKGKEGESLLTDLLTKAGYICEPSPRATVGYDILCKLCPKEFKVEVKYDVMASKTGNVALEYWNSKSNKASGITATTAHLWCYVIGAEKEVWLTHVDKLKMFMQSAKPVKIIYKGGNKNSDMLIYNKDEFCKTFDRIDLLQPIELFRVVQCLTSTLD